MKRVSDIDTNKQQDAAGVLAGAVPTLEFLKPPQGMWRKLKYYSARHGVIHAVCSFLGRKWLRSWLWLGPTVTRPYLRKWLSTSGPRVLNLGGGGLQSDRWLAADVDPRSDVFMDVTKPLPIPDEIVDAVYSEEVIEHIDRKAGQRMLVECFRVLKPRGTLRITTPSLDYFAKRILSNPESVFEVNDIFYHHGHQFIYSEAELRQALKAAGFVNITQSSYHDPNSKYGAFDSHPARFSFAPPEWSQYWEAQKPEGTNQGGLGTE